MVLMEGVLTVEVVQASSQVLQLFGKVSVYLMFVDQHSLLPVKFGKVELGLFSFKV